MKQPSPQPAPVALPEHTLAELCALTGLTPRTVRYYVQIGLVDRPVGETRAARYGARQLEQLLLIRKWTAAGVALERIRDLLHGGAAPVPPRTASPGSVEVRSHIALADGVELVIERGRAGLTAAQVRVLARGALALLHALEAAPPAPGLSIPSDKDAP